MQSSSADTNFTFGDNVVAVAESGNQSSPATDDSGAASGTTWNNIPSRRSKGSASNRSVGRNSRRSTCRVDSERQGDLPHDQGHRGQPRTDLRGPGKLRGKGEPTALNISPLNKQLVKRYWNFKEEVRSRIIDQSHA